MSARRRSGEGAGDRSRDRDRRGALIVEADGGSRGNPGVAGYGAVVRLGSSGQVLAERAAPLGRASNNVAEYTGLIEGLRAAGDVDRGADVEVRMDSKLVVEQMSGRWKIKHDDMQRLAGQARELVAQRAAAGGSVAFTWVPRDENKAADRLSNEGMDGRTVDRRYDAADGVDPDDDPDPAEGSAEGSAGGSAEGSAEGSAGGARDGAKDGAADGAAPGAEERSGAGRPRRGAAAARVCLPGSPDLSEPVRFVLVRHGRTAATMAGQLDGRGGSDGPLTDEGRQQSVAAGHALRRLLRDGPAPLLVSSSLARARQSAAAIGGVLRVEPEADAAWDEQHFGDWEGRTVAEVCADAEGAAAYERLRREPDYARPGGESRADLERRVLAAYERLTDRAREDRRPVLVVSHRAALLAVLGAELGLGSPWSLSLAPSSLSGLRRWADAASVDFVNDTAHLRS